MTDPINPDLLPPSGSEPAATPRRNDRISPLVVIVLVVFWLMQSTLIAYLTSASKPHGKITAGTDSDSRSGASTDLVQGLITIDLQAKMSYALRSAPAARGTKNARGSFSAALDKALATSLGNPRAQALSDASDLLRKYPDQPSMARRVILLRAETGNPSPLSPLPPVKGKAGPSPLDAYRPAADAGAGAPFQPQLDAERATWQAIFGQPKIAPQSVPGLIARVRALSNLRFYTPLAERQIYLRAGDAVGAARALDSARREAAISVAATSGLNYAILLVSLVGVGALLMLLWRWMNAARVAGSLFNPTAPLIADEERRLGAGDLINLFALYVGLMLAASAAAPILLAGPLKSVAESPAQRVTLIIGAEAVLTIFCGGATVWALSIVARRRGASLAREIGLNTGTQPLPRILLFGIIGWGMALPLVLAASGLSKLLFHNAPAPANPAIPLLIATPAGIAAVMLYVLIALLAPFFEETLFRGIFYNAVRLRAGVRWGIVLTGLAFGLAHSVGIGEQLPLAVLGGFFAWMAETRKSLLPSMLAHCLQNSFVYATLLFSLMTIMQP